MTCDLCRGCAPHGWPRCTPRHPVVRLCVSPYGWCLELSCFHSNRTPPWSWLDQVQGVLLSEPTQRRGPARGKQVSELLLRLCCLCYILSSHDAANMLFFGCRSKCADFFFGGEWSAMVEAGLLTLHTAFSRDQDYKVIMVWIECPPTHVACVCVCVCVGVCAALYRARGAGSVAVDTSQAGSCLHCRVSMYRTV